MTKIEHKARLRSCATIALAVTVLSIGTTANAQNLSGSSIAAPSYGIPPAANTARALNEPPGVIEGVLSGFYASLGVAVATTDNVNRVPESSELYDSDTVIAFTPRLGYQTNLGRHQAFIEYSGFSENYQDFTNLDAMDNRIHGAINFDLTDKLDAGIWAGWADVNERRGTSGAPVLQIDPNEVEITDFGGDLRYGTMAARHMQFRIGVEAENWRYQNNDQQFRDRDTTGAYGEIHYNVSDITSVFVLAGFRNFEYTSANAANSDSDETTLEVGAEWQATSKTSGRVSVGQQDKDYDDPSVEDQDTTTYLARVSWNPKSYTTVNFYGSKRFEEASTVLGDAFVSTLWGIGATHSFAKRWNGNIHYNYITDDYDDGREDNYHDFGIGVNYLFRWWLSFGAQYGYIKRDSTLAINEYDENVFGLTMQLNYSQQ